MKTMKLLITALLAAAATAAFAATAQENWKAHCAKCHADDGSGKTTMGKKLKLADYTTAEGQAGFTDEEALAAIRDGVKEGTKFKMVAFNEKLSEEEMLDLVKFLRSMGPQQVAEAKAECDEAKACCKAVVAEEAKKECCKKVEVAEKPEGCCAAKAAASS